MISAMNFLAAAEQIAAEEPAYKSGHDGHDGYCDCIGLIIGAIRRCGGQWRGLHGSNYAARKEIAGSLLPIAGTGDLQPGEIVFKAYEPGQGGYNLPERYYKGNEYYNGDLRDYFHVGIVVSVFPLRILHMTTPRPKVDTSIGKWGYHAKAKNIDYSGGDGKMETVIISGGNQDQPIRLRRAASTSSTILAEIPQNSEATLLEGGGTWNRVNWNGMTGYVMSVFVHAKGADPDTVTVNRAELERVYDTLGDMLGLRG